MLLSACVALGGGAAVLQDSSTICLANLEIKYVEQASLKHVIILLPHYPNCCVYEGEPLYSETKRLSLLESETQRHVPSCLNS